MYIILERIERKEREGRRKYQGIKSYRVFPIISTTSSTLKRTSICIMGVNYKIIKL